MCAQANHDHIARALATSLGLRRCLAQSKVRGGGRGNLSASAVSRELSFRHDRVSQSPRPTGLPINEIARARPASGR
jgi:hypothetical protein